MQVECTRAEASEPREGIERRAKAEAAPFETTRPMWVLKVYPASLLSEAHPARLTLRSLMDYLIQIQVYLLQVYLHLVTKERL